MRLLGLPKSLDRMEEAWSEDTKRVTRWYSVELIAEYEGEEVLILRRVMGWDDSSKPPWIQDVDRTNFVIRVAELAEGQPWTVEDDREIAKPRWDGRELRRIEPRMDSFIETEPAVDQWGLSVPCAHWEVWCDDDAYEAAREAWESLSEADMEFLSEIRMLPSHVPEEEEVGKTGYAGSTIVHVPLYQPFLPDLHKLVLPEGRDPWGDLSLVSIIVDGPVELESTSEKLELEPYPDTPPDEGTDYLEVYCPEGGFSEIASAVEEKTPRFIASTPSLQVVGVPATEHAVLVPESAPPTVISCGHVKRIGFTLSAHPGPRTRPAISNHMVRFSGETWVDRVPQFSHSVPVELNHIPPGDGSEIQKAFDRLAEAGSNLLLCDPYVSRSTLTKLLDDEASCQLLTTQSKFDDLGVDWCRDQNVEVKIISDEEGGVHDRFLIGDERAFVLGTSLTGIGNKHSFIIEADNRLRWSLREVFEELWDDAPPASPSTHESPSLGWRLRRWIVRSLGGTMRTS